MIDDYDLRLTLVLRPCGNTRVETSTTTQKPVRIIPSPTCIVQAAKLRKQTDFQDSGEECVMSTQKYIKKVVDDVGEDVDFKRGSWVSAIEYMDANGGIVSGCLGYIKNFLKNGKLDRVVALVKSCTPNVLGDLIVTLKDLLCTIDGSIHHKVIDDGGYGKDITVFHKDTVPGSGSGVGGSGMLDEEEIMKCLGEKEMVELELQELLDFLFLGAEGGALGSPGALKPSIHPVMAIFLYPLEAEVEAASALEVEVEATFLVGALKVGVEAVGALDPVEVEATCLVRAIDLVLVEVETTCLVGVLDLVGSP
ncbi:hypothetical protein Tco_0693123 [Tanacetum coccineum]